MLGLTGGDTGELGAIVQLPPGPVSAMLTVVPVSSVTVTTLGTPGSSGGTATVRAPFGLESACSSLETIGGGPVLPANESVYCQEPFALLSASRFSNTMQPLLSEVEVLAVLAVSVVNVPLGTVGAEPLPLHVPVTVAVTGSARNRSVGS